ncbi:MAG: transglycosylase domain-containing protein [Phaeodactylibacter sp.]|nr:transglycosylase domain-containing protein [Phaeodactylibacter sp.]
MKDRWINFKLRFAVSWYNFWIDYPAAGWTVKGVKVLLVLAFIAGSAFIASIAAGAFGKLPNEEDLAGVTHYVASEVYASDSTLLGRYYFENRSNVKYRDISPHFINALIATEDARFFEHNGIDFRAWFRVFFKTILSGERSSGGGSTISQQLAKNIYPREDYGKYSLIINKIKEVFIAMRLEKLYDKEKLLELYLNTVPFSENTFGIKVAAQRFYNTSPSRLTPSQSAVLVAMLKATTVYNPVSQPQNALARRNLVLGQMAKYGYLSRRLADSLVKEPLSLNYFPITHNKGPAPYFREHLRLELKELLKDKRKPNGMAYNIYTDGLKIYTSVNARMQAIAENVVAEQMKSLQKEFTRHLNGADPWETEGVLEMAKRQSTRYRSLLNAGLDSTGIDSVFRIPVEMEVFSWKGGKEKRKMSPLDSIKHYLGLLNAGFLALDPKTGEVLAWVGGINHEFFQYDHVLSTRSVGSTFKPIVYAAALQKGIPPCSYFPNQLRVYPQYEYWMPKNATNEYGGYYSLEGGLINSVNTVTVQLMMQAGPKSVARLAHSLGIGTEIPAVPAIALGAADVSLRDMATVYSTFAARGARPEVHYIRRVEAPDGAVLIDNEWQKDTCNWERPLWEEEADMMNQMLQAVIDRGTGRRIRYRYNMKYPLAGKTGTSQNHSDGWFIGYTPRIVAGAWVGAESPAVRFRDLRLGQGANTGLPIVAFFLQELFEEEKLKGYVDAPFPRPGAMAEQLLSCPPVVWPGKEEATEGKEGGEAPAKTVSNDEAPAPSEATAKLEQ